MSGTAASSSQTYDLAYKHKTPPYQRRGLGWIVYMSGGTAASSRRIRGFGNDKKNDTLIYTQRLDSKSKKPPFVKGRFGGNVNMYGGK